ncbi:hypothetical protein ACPCSP_20290 [Streptomyces cinereoruber]|uniref:hypothetical protein n=1 Tax=Streptomyces cinereoruber TaxID=67260 RepID=UPI003C2B0F96
MSRPVLVQPSAVAARAEYCRCTTVQNYDYDEAAAKLRCKARFLQDRISSLPHQRLGESVSFCDCELAIIRALFSTMPSCIKPALDVQEQPTPANVLRSIAPARARRNKTGS